MCSIYGFLAPAATRSTFIDDIEKIRLAAQDRGRDGGKMQIYHIPSKQGSIHDKVACLGNWRAIPTPELKDAPFQPYGGIIHNGTIANDKELGCKKGEVDSMVLPRILDRKSLQGFVDSLGKIEGSYAIAAFTGTTVYLACNYKPIYMYSPDGESVYFSSLERHFRDVVPFGQSAVPVGPYEAVDLLTKERIEIPRQTSKKAVISASGGLDSTVAAAMLIKEKYEVTLLHMKYGCHAESQEADRIPKIAKSLGCAYEFLDISYARTETSSLLTDKLDIAKGVSGAEYAHEWVPARNLLMLGHAAAYAESTGAHYIALGNNLEEAGAYPDNEQEMMILMDRVLNYSVQEGYNLRLLDPLGSLMKHEIVMLGKKLGAPLELTWSCYRNGEKHCGECGPCFMRRTAFKRNNLDDPVFKRPTIKRKRRKAATVK